MRPTFCIRGFAYIHYAVQFPLHPLVFTAPGFRGPFVYSGILFRKASCSSLCPSIMFFFMPKIRDQFLDGRKKLYFILVESWKFYLTNSTWNAIEKVYILWPQVSLPSCFQILQRKMLDGSGPGREQLQLTLRVLLSVKRLGRVERASAIPLLQRGKLRVRDQWFVWINC